MELRFLRSRELALPISPFFSVWSLIGDQKADVKYNRMEARMHLIVMAPGMIG